MRLTRLGPGDLYCQDIEREERLHDPEPSCPTCDRPWDECPGGDETQCCAYRCPICRTVTDDDNPMMEDMCTDEPRLCSECWSEVLAECAEDAVEEEVTA